MASDPEKAYLQDPSPLDKGEAKPNKGFLAMAKKHAWTIGIAAVVAVVVLLGFIYRNSIMRLLGWKKTHRHAEWEVAVKYADDIVRLKAVMEIEKSKNRDKYDEAKLKLDALRKEGDELLTALDKEYEDEGETYNDRRKHYALLEIMKEYKVAQEAKYTDAMGRQPGGTDAYTMAMTELAVVIQMTGDFIKFEEEDYAAVHPPNGLNP